MLQTCAGVKQRLFLLVCRCVANWLQDNPAQPAETETCSQLMDPTLVPPAASSLCWVANNESYLDFIIRFRWAVYWSVSLNGSLGSVQLLSARVCRRRFTHFLHYCRTQGRSHPGLFRHALHPVSSAHIWASSFLLLGCTVSAS